MAYNFTYNLRLYEQQVSSTGIFLWIVRNFSEQLFYRISPNNYFYSETQPFAKFSLSV